MNEGLDFGMDLDRRFQGMRGNAESSRERQGKEEERLCVVGVNELKIGDCCIRMFDAVISMWGLVRGVMM